MAMYTEIISHNLKSFSSYTMCYIIGRLNVANHGDFPKIIIEGCNPVQFTRCVFTSLISSWKSAPPVQIHLGFFKLCCPVSRGVNVSGFHPGCHSIPLMAICTAGQLDTGSASSQTSSSVGRRHGWGAGHNHPPPVICYTGHLPRPL